EVFCRDKLPLLPWRDVAVVANLYATSLEDYAELAAVLAGEEGVAALEVNISCPNVSAGGALFGQDPALAEAVTRAVATHAGAKPVIVKLSPNVTDIAVIARACENGGADMLSCVNTLQGMAVDPRTRRPRIANIIGGLSGPAIKPVALRCVWQTAKAVSIPVIGIGGIMSAEDVLEFILVGAHAVQIGAASFQRPDAAFRIAAELPALMDELGIPSLAAFRGSLEYS
ncbi:MAG: dihydroorotate dehydrogenase, partial [Deltaproteobacteria bacterium]|nr:dihydroorotate dehydrogenase [Deltaproteobacteria bacterium]